MTGGMTAAVQAACLLLLGAGAERAIQGAKRPAPARLAAARHHVVRHSPVPLVAPCQLLLTTAALQAALGDAGGWAAAIGEADDRAVWGTRPAPLIGGVPAHPIDVPAAPVAGPVPVPGAAAIPEPATWTMMVVGFGLVGTMVRADGQQARS